MTAPLLHPLTAKSPLDWARAEAAALEQHAHHMEASHGPGTKGASLCRFRAAALRWLVTRAEAEMQRQAARPSDTRGEARPSSSISRAESGGGK